MKRTLLMLALVLALGAVSAFAANQPKTTPTPVTGVTNAGWGCPGMTDGGYGYGMYGPRAGWHGQGHRGWGHGPGYGHGGWHGQGGYGLSSGAMHDYE